MEGVRFCSTKRNTFVHVSTALCHFTTKVFLIIQCQFIVEKEKGRCNVYSSDAVQARRLSARLCKSFFKQVINIF